MQCIIETISDRPRVSVSAVRGFAPWTSAPSETNPNLNLTLKLNRRRTLVVPTRTQNRNHDHRSPQ